MNLSDGLRLVIAKAPSAMREASSVLRSLSSGNALAQQRAERCIEKGLADPQASFTTEERVALAGLLSGTPDESRTLTIRLRVNAEEKQQVMELAAERGVSVSTLLRECLGLK